MEYLWDVVWRWICEFGINGEKVSGILFRNFKYIFDFWDLNPIPYGFFVVLYLRMGLKRLIVFPKYSHFYVDVTLFLF